MFFSFKTVGQLQVIHQPLYRPKQVRAGEYAVGRKIGLERVNMFATASHPSSFNIRLTLSSHLHLGFPSSLLLSSLPSKVLHALAMTAVACSIHNIISNCV
jgi:hypothetical protein